MSSWTRMYYTYTHTSNDNNSKSNPQGTVEWGSIKSSGANLLLLLRPLQQYILYSCTSNWTILSELTEAPILVPFLHAGPSWSVFVSHLVLLPCPYPESCHHHHYRDNDDDNDPTGQARYGRLQYLYTLLLLLLLLLLLHINNYVQVVRTGLHKSIILCTGSAGCWLWLLTFQKMSFPSLIFPSSRYVVIFFSFYSRLLLISLLLLLSPSRDSPCTSTSDKTSEVTVFSYYILLLSLDHRFPVLLFFTYTTLYSA